MRKLIKTRTISSKGKRLNKNKLADMPKFTRRPNEDPHAPVKIRKVSLEEMVKKEVHGDDEAKGIY